MRKSKIEVIKSSGEKAKFSMDKLSGSLKRSGADNYVVGQIVDTLRSGLYEGISTKEIYNRAFAQKKEHPLRLGVQIKKAIYELGPTGFPFEREGNMASLIIPVAKYYREISNSYEGEGP